MKEDTIDSLKCAGRAEKIYLDSFEGDSLIINRKIKL
jgi:hypothetical protein